KLGKPFFIQMSHYGTGAAEEVTPEALERTGKLLPRLSGKNLAQAAGVVDMDIAIGRVLAALDELGISGTTYIFFSTDHGTPGGGGGMKGNGTGANAPLAGAKGSVREGGIRVPFIVKGPGIAAGKVIHERGTGMDLLPTMLDLAGKPLARSATPDAKTVVEGGSLVPVFKTGGSGKVVRPREEIVMHFPHYDLNNGGPASALFLGDYKLIRNYDTGQVMLFDIRKDIAEEKNLAGEEPERVKDLEAKLDAYLKAVHAQMPTPKEQATTDSPTQPTTQPAQDPQIQDPAKKGPGNKNPGTKDKKNQQNKKPKPADKGSGAVTPTP
ncbi:MAG: sulfatase-like hydrolase/transferase, partial [Planctomycetota bacterium]|nr:sulfatase-like hydrolase/transferase [Planctomycetota bacterium]